jgi:hypothetical protein
VFSPLLHFVMLNLSNTMSPSFYLLCGCSFYPFGMGSEYVHWVRWLLVTLLYQPRMIYECGAVGGMSGEGNRSTCRLSATNST